MYSYIKQDFQEVAMFLHHIKTSLPESLNTYPILRNDVEGEQIVLEIAHDKSGVREILLSFYIDIDSNMQADSMGKFISNNEVLITITNNAQLIGLLNLLLLALGTQVKTVHPIDKDGHFSPFELENPCCYLRDFNANLT